MSTADKVFQLIDMKGLTNITIDLLPGAALGLALYKTLLMAGIVYIGWSESDAILHPALGSSCKYQTLSWRVQGNTSSYYNYANKAETTTPQDRKKHTAPRGP